MSPSQNCRLYLRPNCTDFDRTCDIIFNSLDHDCQRVLKVTQEHLDIIEVTKSYEYGSFTLYLDSGFIIGQAATIDDNGNGYAENWITWTELRENINIILYENVTGKVRQIRMVVYDSNQVKHRLVSIIQNPE